jgi:hypothetical protein
VGLGVHRVDAVQSVNAAGWFDGTIAWSLDA